MLVIDASIALSWVFPDEESAVANAVLDRLPVEAAIVPAVWSLEMTNALLIGERRGRLSREQVADALAFLRRLPIEPAASAWDLDFGVVMSLARTHELTSYDAAYVELALRSSARLASLDSKMLQAAVEAGVRVVAV